MIKILIALTRPLNWSRNNPDMMLQKAMGHSSLNVSLTYLRGLEVAELKEEDMPMVWSTYNNF
jgi:integrase